MICKTVDENGVERFGISSGGSWLPGSFDSERAATYAFRFDCEAIQRLQDEKNRTDGTPISFADLQALRYEKTRHAREG